MQEQIKVADVSVQPWGYRSGINETRDPASMVRLVGEGQDGFPTDSLCTIPSGCLPFAVCAVNDSLRPGNWLLYRCYSRRQMLAVWKKIFAEKVRERGETTKRVPLNIIGWFAVRDPQIPADDTSFTVLVGDLEDDTPLIVGVREVVDRLEKERMVTEASVYSPPRHRALGIKSDTSDKEFEDLIANIGPSLEAQPA